MIMQRCKLGAASLAAAAAPGSALADQGDYAHGHGMMWGGGWLHMAFGSIMMILMVAAIVVLVVLALRWLASSGHAPFHPPPASSTRTPLEILKERLARGEIDVAEYEERRRALGE